MLDLLKQTYEDLAIFIGVVNHLDPIDTGDDYLTNREKEELCKPIYERICSVILDEDGIIKDNVERSFWRRVCSTYKRHDIEGLQKLELELYSE